MRKNKLRHRKRQGKFQVQVVNLAFEIMINNTHTHTVNKPSSRQHFLNKPVGFCAIIVYRDCRREEKNTKLKCLCFSKYKQNVFDK